MKTPRQAGKISINRRDFFKTAALAGAGVAGAPALVRALAQNENAPVASSDNPQPAFRNPHSPNILMIAIDDLRDWVNYLGCHQARTPNLDRLAAMGMALTRAYCPAPLCNPSRAALLTGLRPSTTGVYANEDDWRANKIAGGVPTLPAWLRKHGYVAYGAGKIYHDVYRRGSDWTEFIPNDHQKALPSLTTNLGVKSIRFRPLSAPDSALNDYKTVDYCIGKLREKFDKPFLLGCGMHKPHMPWEVPQKYFDMYPLDKIELPKVQPNLDDLPPEGVKMARSGGEHAAMLKSGRWKEAVQAYLACITYLDTQIGRLLDAFEKSAYKDNTIILFWADHGWHLGEKHHWKKFALWEEATRVPVIWVVPGVTKPGSLCSRALDHMGIYPTLCEVAGVPPPPHLEGASYRALLENPEGAWNRPAVCTYMRNNHTVRTEKWRYIRYAGGGEELYDHDADPLEWKNLAKDSKYASVKEDLKKWLPKTNAAGGGKKGGKGAKDG